MRIASLLLVFALAACATKPAGVIVTAPKTRLAVGESVALDARLAKTDSTTPVFFWWRTGLDEFELKGNMLTAKKPGNVMACAGHWYSYLPKPDGLSHIVRVGTESQSACVWLTSRPAK